MQGLTDKGAVRDHNEDAFWFDLELGAALVADGVGGMAAGDVASAMTVAAFERVIRARLATASSLDQVKELLANAVGLANQEVQDRIGQDSSKKNMGSTAVCACWWQGVMVIAHIGDSRAYLMRGQQIIRLTKDHSYVQLLVDEGAISEAEARRHPQRNLITRCIGADDEAEADIRALEVEQGDWLLLCSDGLSGVLADEALRSTVEAAGDVQQAVAKLVQAALAGGAPDNVTALLIQCGERRTDADTAPALSDTGSHPTVSIELNKNPGADQVAPDVGLTGWARGLEQTRHRVRQAGVALGRYGRAGLVTSKKGLVRFGAAMQRIFRRCRMFIDSLLKK